MVRGSTDDFVPLGTEDHGMHSDGRSMKSGDQFRDMIDDYTYRGYMMFSVGSLVLVCAVLISVNLAYQFNHYNDLKDRMENIQVTVDQILDDITIPIFRSTGKDMRSKRQLAQTLGRYVASLYIGDAPWNEDQDSRWDQYEQDRIQDSTRWQKQFDSDKNLRKIIETSDETLINILTYQTENITDIENLVKEIAENTDTALVEGWPQWTREANGQLYSSPQANSITRDNAEDLSTLCDLPFSTVPTVGSNAQPVVRGDYVFFPSVDTGEIFCYNRYTCERLWYVDVAEIFEDNIPASGTDVKVNASTSVITARQSPVLYRRDDQREVLLFGAPSDRFDCIVNNVTFCQNLSTYVIELDMMTGNYLRHVKTTDQSVPEEFNSHYAGSATTSEGKIYFGTSSFANVFTQFGTPCLHIGALHKIDIENMTLSWKSYTLPTGTGAGGWCGASIWARIAVDEELGNIYTATGNTQYHPADVEACFAGADPNNPANYSQLSIDCLADAKTLYPGEVIAPDSLIAFRITDGNVQWTYSPGGLDTFNTACPQFGPNPRDGGGIGCQGFQGPDWDFGGTVSIVDLGVEKIIVGGSKSGAVFAVEAVSGDPRWGVNLGPGGTVGGVHWSGGYNPDLELFYAHNAGDASIDGYQSNVLSAPNLIARDVQTCNAGTTHAIDVKTGNIVWQSVDGWGNYSVDGVGTFPPDCTFSNVSFVVEEFKKAWNLTNTAGEDRLVDAGNSTATFATPCVRDTSGPANLQDPEFARQHGAIAVTQDIIFSGSMTGLLYAQDARTGDCLNVLPCGRGGIYGGATVVDDQVFVQCGYGKFVPPWIGVADGNQTRVFQL